MPKISFVLPTFNRIAWLPRCIETLQDQTERDIEIILINDNSDDGTKEFLDEYAPTDSRIVVVHNETNLGAGKSRNIGTSLAKSEIVCVCDDDDYYPEDKASVVLRWFEENQDSELVNFPYVRVDMFETIMEYFWGSKFDHDAFKKDGTVTYFCNPSVAFKKKAAISMGGYLSEKRNEDGKVILTDDAQFIKAWVDSGRKIDFDNRAFGVFHRVLPNSMMSQIRGWKPEWSVKS